MTKVILELDSLTINRPKPRWNLYFVLVAEHPTDKDKLVTSIIPGSHPIKVVPSQNNRIDFDSGNSNTGLLLLKRELSANEKELNVHLHVMHSRRNQRDLGEILSNLESGIGGSAFGTVTNIFGTSNPWLVIAKGAVSLIGQILAKSPDRNMGFFSLFERFDTSNGNQEEIDYEKTGGHITLVYSWATEN